MRGPLEFHSENCRACRMCEVICSVVKEGQAVPSLARINVFFDEFEPETPISAALCYQCDDAACMSACPVEAIYRDEATGTVIIREQECVGCMQCREACPWGIPKRHPERGVALKCDLCAGRAGGPACVEFCPLAGKALIYTPVEHHGRG